jgi:hypothetical protein
MAGAPRKNPPSYASAEVRTLTATGFSKVGIASHFGVAVETLDRWLEESLELRECFAAGREDERQALHNALYRKAMNGDGPAAMFLLKARHGYREGDQRDESNRVSITFNLPGALKADEYRVIDGNSGTSAKQLPNQTA